MTYKNGDKVCARCAGELDKENSHLPWHSEQIKAKNKWIEELLQEIELLKSPKKVELKRFKRRKQEIA